MFSGFAAHLDLGIEPGWSNLVPGIYSVLVVTWALRGIGLVVDHALASIYGPGVSSETIQAAHIGTNSAPGHLRSALVILYALGPVEDVVHTVRYMCPLNSTTTSDLVTARYSIRYTDAYTPS